MKLLFRERNENVFGESCIFEWRPGGNHIAVGGNERTDFRSNGCVRIYTRYGDVAEEFSINESISTLNWDRDGELLAVTNNRAPTLVLFAMSTNSVQTMDISVSTKNMPTFLCWSPVEPILVVGDNRGNVTIYNHRTSRKTPIMGKHQRAIQCGAFSEDGSIFALGSEDGMVTVNNIDGDTINIFSCPGETHGVRIKKFRRFDDVNSDKPEEFVSAVVSRRNLMLVKLSQPENLMTLQFQDKYGDIITTEWY